MFETFQKQLPIKLSTVVSIALSFLIIGIVAYLCVWNIRTNEGLWIVYDDVQVSRTLLMVDELQSGQFPVRMVSSLAGGAGYMLFHFNSPAIYYLTAAGVLSGINPVNVTKLAFQLAYICAGVGMLFFLKRLPTSWFLSVGGSALLLTSTYFNYDVYHRGALPEVWGFALIPWLFFFYQSYSKSKQKWYLLGLAVVAAGMVYVHVITAFIALPLLLLWIVFDLWISKNSRELCWLLLTGLITLLLAASYLLPVVMEKQFVQYEGSSFVQKDFRKEFRSPWETLGLQANNPEALLVTAGAGLTLLAICSLVILMFHRKIAFKSSNTKGMFFKITISLLLVLFLQMGISWFIWQYVPLINLTQFPYRYLTATTFFAITLIVFGFSYAKKWIAYPLLLLGLLFGVYSNQPYFKPVGYYFADTFIPTGPCATTTWDNEYLPKWVEDCSLHQDYLASPSAGVAIKELSAKNNEREIIFTASGSGSIRVEKFFFPGWTATDQRGSDVPITIVPVVGTMQIPISGEQTISIVFVDTLVRKLGNWLTAIGVIAWLGLAVYILRSALFPKRK